MQSKFKRTVILLTFTLVVMQLSCASKNGVKFTKKVVKKKSNIAVIIDSPNNIKNVVLTAFMKKGFNVKAINASDLYNREDIFDIKDFKKMSENSPTSSENTILSMEKTYENVSKLHIYNFEASKAEYLNKIRDKWNVKYLIILDLKNWQEVSWGRAIELKTYDLVWIENYPTKYSDNIESIINHFVASMSKK